MENSAPCTYPGHPSQETTAILRWMKLSANGRNPRSIHSFGASRGFWRSQFERGRMAAKTMVKLTHFTDYFLPSSALLSSSGHAAYLHILHAFRGGDQDPRPFTMFK